VYLYIYNYILQCLIYAYEFISINPVAYAGYDPCLPVYYSLNVINIKIVCMYET